LHGLRVSNSKLEPASFHFVLQQLILSDAALADEIVDRWKHEPVIRHHLLCLIYSGAPHSNPARNAELDAVLPENLAVIDVAIEDLKDFVSDLFDEACRYVP
jgi:hypothetical protein